MQNKILLKNFIRCSGIPQRLIRSVVKQSGGWEMFTETACDVARGAVNGFYGFIASSETCKFFEANRDEILAVIENDYGGNFIELYIAKLPYFPGSMDTALMARVLYQIKIKDESLRSLQIGVFNALSWYALERVAAEYTTLAGGKNGTQ